MERGVLSQQVQEQCLTLKITTLETSKLGVTIYQPTLITY
jgi:hypothetical protein